MKCEKCKNEIPEGVLQFEYKGKLLCEVCLEDEAAEGEVCPNCGAAVGVEDAVTLLLEHPEASRAKLDMASRVSLTVCPKCHILFTDDFTYAVMKSLRSKS